LNFEELLAAVSDFAFEEARAEYQRDPGFESFVRWYHALRGARRAQEAIELVLSWKDRAPSAIQTAQVGVFCNDLGLYEDAKTCLNAAAPLLPTNKYLALQVRMELVTSYALLGEADRAQSLFRSLRTHREWEEVGLESVVPPEQMAPYAPYLTNLLENDCSAAGRRVFVLGEGGFGDKIWFFRYAQDLLAEGAVSVTWPPVPGLEMAFRASDPRIHVGDGGDYDAALRTCSLSARYQTHPYFPQTPGVARDMPYLVAPIFKSKISPRLNATKIDRPRVGLIWRSNGPARHEPFRSMTLPDLEAVVTRQGLSFESLQYGPALDGEIDQLMRFGIRDRGPEIADFGDAARLISELDLLITIDTSAAHLAGALGVPVWLLLAKTCDYRWGPPSRHTAWYRQMRHYRQIRLGDWADPLRDLCEDLDRL
jgi:hypothetical protein